MHLHGSPRNGIILITIGYTSETTIPRIIFQARSIIRSNTESFSLARVENALSILQCEDPPTTTFKLRRSRWPTPEFANCANLFTEENVEASQYMLEYIHRRSSSAPQSLCHLCNTNGSRRSRGSSLCHL